MWEIETNLKMDTILFDFWWIASENSSETTSAFPSCTHKVLFPLLHPKRERALGHSQRVHLHSAPSQTGEKDGERKKKGEWRGGRSEMCFKDGSAPTRCCTAPFSCLRMGWRPQRGRTDGPLCGNQRWLQSSTSSNSAAFHTKKVCKPLSIQAPLHVQTHF